MIEIRNEITGEAKHFQDKQAVADFLDGRPDTKDWDVGRLGKLPAASKEDKPAEIVGTKVAVDDGRVADESPSRHLVDPVHSEEASAENRAKEEADRKAEADAIAQEQQDQAEAAEAAQAKGRRAAAKTTDAKPTAKGKK